MNLSKQGWVVFKQISRGINHGFCSCTAVESILGRAARDSYRDHSQAKESHEGFKDLFDFSGRLLEEKKAIRCERVADWLEWLEKGNQLGLFPIPQWILNTTHPSPPPIEPWHYEQEFPNHPPEDPFQDLKTGEKRAAGRSNVSTDQRDHVIVAESQPRASASQAKDDVHRAILSGDPVIRSCVHQLVPTLGLHQLYSLVEQLYHLRYLEREAGGENMRTTVQALGGDQTHD